MSKVVVGLGSRPAANNPSILYASESPVKNNLFEAGQRSSGSGFFPVISRAARLNVK